MRSNNSTEFQLKFKLKNQSKLDIISKLRLLKFNLYPTYLMKLSQYIIAFFLITSFGFSQKIIKHKVVNGESIFAIAKKYNVTQAELFELNPKYKNGVLKLNAVLEVPNKKFKEEKVKVKEKKVVEKKPLEKENIEVVTTTNKEFSTHLVASKETLYSISKKYGVTMETICETNPELKTGALKMGFKIKIPNPNFVTIVEKYPDLVSTPTENTATILDLQKPLISVSTVIHKVQPKESLYKISRIYKVTVKELQELNPDVKNGLPIGYELIVKKEKDLIYNTDDEIKLKDITATKPISLENSNKIDFLIAKASENIGVHYRIGGTTNSGFDCSGLMLASFREINVDLPRTSHDQSNYGYKIDKSQAQKGDLIFFATKSRGIINHVGMIIEVLPNEIKFIHSSSSNGVMISSTLEDYYSRKFMQINRVLSE